MSALRPAEALRTISALGRTWGAKGAVRRTRYELERRAGRLKRFEDRWLDRVREAEISFEPLPVRPSGSTSAPNPGSGITLYGGLKVDSEVPPRWNANPTTGFVHPASVHWSQIRDDDASAGDVKDVWELSRLGWAFDLLRRWAATGDLDDAGRMWEILEDWHRNNPPYLGPNWMCGQETSLRGIAWMFLASALATGEAISPARRAMTASVLAASVGRVVPTIGYALSQRNNHAISEAGFLWTATAVLRELPDADRIRRRAAAALVEAVTDQFAADGSYAQHSPTYQRLAMHVLLWCMFVSRSTGRGLPPEIGHAVERGSGFLRGLMVDGSDGRVPNLGGNDGALLFPLSGQPIGDFRPLLTHAAAATGEQSIERGPWDAEAEWFGLSPSAPGRAASPSTSSRINVHVLRGVGAYATVRGGPLRHRPAHADQLHTDVWLDGRPVAVDAGSFRYTAEQPWGNALADESAHNVPFVPRRPQARRRGRFLWTEWREAKVEGRWRTPTLEAALFRLELAEGVEMWRLVALSSGTVMVVDRASTPGASVRWRVAGDCTPQHHDGSLRLGSDAVEVDIWAADEPTVSRGVEDDPASGWVSWTYGVKEPLTSVVVHHDSTRSVVTSFRTRQGGRQIDPVAARVLPLNRSRLTAERLETVFNPPATGS